MLRAVREQGLDGLVLRVSVACGPGAPAGSLSGTVAAHLAAGRDVVRLAPLRAHRDLVDVRDIADAVVSAARVPAPALAGAEALVNIGRGERPGPRARRPDDRMVRPPRPRAGGPRP